ncbi:MAG: MFS transporter [Acetobacteraceae bacterium]|nr:MFS transporter [Acetobacteraceae bacterium]
MAPRDGLAEAEAGPSRLPSRHLFFRVFPSIMLPMFLASVDGTIVAAALPTIAAEMGEVERVSWVVVAFLVAATIAAPVYGKLGDVIGRRRMLLVALGINLIAYVLCATAGSMTMLVLARVLHGFGAGGLMTLAHALIGETVPPRERGRYQGYNASIYVSASMFGPVAGGWLTQHWGWQAVFLVNVPLCLLAVALAFRLKPGVPAGGRLHFDFLGAALFALFIAPALLALEQARRFRWEAMPWAAGLLGLAIASLMLLLRQERRATSPLLPVQLLKQSAVWRTDALAAASGAAIVALITFLPIYLAVVRGVQPGEIGLLMLPLTALTAVGSLTTGQIIARTGYTAIVPSIGQAICACLVVLLALVGHGLSNTELSFLLGGIALSSGTAMPVVQVTLQLLAGPKQLGAASASVQFSRSIGAAVGTAVVSAVLFATLAATDGEIAALFGRIIQEGRAAFAHLSPARASEAQAEIREAFRAAFLTVAALSATASALAWSIPLRRI